VKQIVAGMFISLDGVVEAPEAWTGPYFTPEVGQAVGAMVASADTLLLGRVTYQNSRRPSRPPGTVTRWPAR